MPTSSIHGKYVVRLDGRTAYKYHAQYTTDYPSTWEARVWREEDVVNNFIEDTPRIKFNGPFITTNSTGQLGLRCVAHDILRELVRKQVERKLEEWVSSQAGEKST
jgi:hypothetical protein